MLAYLQCDWKLCTKVFVVVYSCVCITVVVHSNTYLPVYPPTTYPQHLPTTPAHNTHNNNNNTITNLIKHKHTHIYTHTHTHTHTHKESDYL